MFISLHRYLVVDALMAAAVVVILDVAPDALPQAWHVVLGVDVDMLRLDGTPEALYPDVVLAAATAIHADLDVESLTGLLTYYICKSLAEITNYIEGFCFSNIAFTSNSVIPFSLSLLKSLILR